MDKEQLCPAKERELTFAEHILYIGVDTGWLKGRNIASERGLPRLGYQTSM